MNIDQKVEAYRQAVELAGLELKGKNNFYTSHNGHMFSFFGKPAIVAIRLSKDEQEKFLKKYKTPFPVRQYNSNMRDYVELPDEVLKNKNHASKYLKKSFEYIDTLKSK